MSTGTVEGQPGSTRRERVGWYFYDWANSAFYTTVITVFLGPYLGSIARAAAGCDGTECDDRYIYPLGIPVAPNSYFPYVVSLSVLLSVLVLPVVGAIADRSPSKRRLMGFFAYAGAAATVAMGLVSGERYLLGGALLIVANIAFGCSVVVYYSFLPQLAGPDERDAVSSRGWAFGFLGGGLLLTLNVAAVLAADAGVLGLSDGAVARLCLVSAGLWWAGFTVIPLRRLRDRPPEPGEQLGGSVLTAGFRQLGRTLAGLRAFPLTLWFLAAYLIYNEGVQTVIALSSVYGTDELELPRTVLVPTILMVQFLAAAGALGLGLLARRIGAWKTVLVSLLLWIVVVAGAYFLPTGRAAPFIVLGAGIGVVLGGTQALSRSLFSQLIPEGREAEYFGLYEISDKGTSWLGPLLFGLVYQATDSYRLAIASLVVFFVVGFATLLSVPIRRAISAVGNVPPRVL